MNGNFIDGGEVDVGISRKRQRPGIKGHPRISGVTLAVTHYIEDIEPEEPSSFSQAEQLRVIIVSANKSTQWLGDH